MCFAGVRNNRAIRIALLLAAGAPLAFSTTAWAAQEAAATTDGGIRFGKWGVDLNSRDLKANPGDDFERYASGAGMDAMEGDPDTCRDKARGEI